MSQRPPTAWILGVAGLLLALLTLEWAVPAARDPNAWQERERNRRVAKLLDFLSGMPVEARAAWLEQVAGCGLPDAHPSLRLWTSAPAVRITGAPPPGDREALTQVLDALSTAMGPYLPSAGAPAPEPAEIRLHYGPRSTFAGLLPDRAAHAGYWAEWASDGRLRRGWILVDPAVEPDAPARRARVKNDLLRLAGAFYRRPGDTAVARTRDILQRTYRAGLPPGTLLRDIEQARDHLESANNHEQTP